MYQHYFLTIFRQSLFYRNPTIIASLYKLAAFLAGTVTQEPLADLIDALGSAFGLMLGMTGSCALALLISIISSVSVVST